MFRTVTLKGAGSTLAAGATDYVTKPANVGNVREGLARLHAELIPKIKLHCRHVLAPTGAVQPLPLRVAGTTGIKLAPVKTAGTMPEIFAIGCSTGGPHALATLFSGITTPLAIPGVIVQHMPPLFTRMLAERLSKDSPNKFFEGEAGQLIEPGSIYLAPGGRHREVVREGTHIRSHLTDQPPENSCRAAVDLFFRSVAAVYGPDTHALIMPGLGQDGLRGGELIGEHGGRILAQDEATSVVWGMPGYIAQAGLAEKVLPLPQIAAEVMRRLPVRALHPVT